MNTVDIKLNRTYLRKEHASSHPEELLPQEGPFCPGHHGLARAPGPGRRETNLGLLEQNPEVKYLKSTNSESAWESIPRTTRTIL